jgi:hypothetical protein
MKITHGGIERKRRGGKRTDGARPVEKRTDGERPEEKRTGGGIEVLFCGTGAADWDWENYDGSGTKARGRNGAPAMRGSC